MGKPIILDQDSFRYRNDDNDEANASWIYALNIDGSLDVDTNYRIRLLIQETNNGAAVSKVWKFQRSYNSGAWTDITTTSSVVKAVSSSYFADGDDCTQQLGSGTFISTNSGMSEDGNTGSVLIGTNYETEAELAFQIVSGDVANNDTIEIRAVESDSTLLGTYTRTPSITVSEAEDVNVQAAMATLSLATHQVNVDAEIDISVNVSSLSLATYQPDVSLNVNAQAGFSALNLVTFQSEIITNVEIDVGVSSLALATYQPNVDAEIDISAGISSLSLATQQAEIEAKTEIDTQTAGLSLATQSANVDVGADVEVNVGVSSSILSTLSASVDAETDIEVGVASLSLATQQADVDAEINIESGKADLTLQTNQAEIIANVEIDAQIINLTLATYSADASIGADVNVLAALAVFNITTHKALVNFIIETSWITNRNLGPWDFTAQENKIGDPPYNDGYWYKGAV